MYFFQKKFILLWFVGASVCGCPMRAIASDNCTDSQQVRMSSINNIVGTVTGILTSLLGTFEVYKYVGFHDNETFLLVFGIVVGFAALLVTCIATPEEPRLQMPEDARNPIAELAHTVRKIPKPALVADAFFIASSLMSYEKGVWASAFCAQCLYGGANTTFDSPQRGLRQDGPSFFFTVNLVHSVVSFAYSWIGTLVAKKLGCRLPLSSLLQPASPGTSARACSSRIFVRRYNRRRADSPGRNRRTGPHRRSELTSQF